MNAYLKVFLYYGLPTTIITSLMAGLLTNDPLGYAFGAGVGGVICIAATLIGGVALDNTKPVTVTQGMRQGMQKFNARDFFGFFIMFTPYLMIFIGALITKAFMQFYIVFPVTLVSSLLSILLLMKFIAKKKPPEPGEKAYASVTVITSIIPMTMMYFMFLAMIFYPDLESFKSLF